MAEIYAVCVLDAEVRTIYFSALSPPPPLTNTGITRELVLNTLSTIPNLTVDVRDDNHLLLQNSSGCFTEMSLLAPCHPMETVSIGFRGGHIELIEVVMEALASQVGSLMLYLASGDDPRLFLSKHDTNI